MIAEAMQTADDFPAGMVRLTTDGISRWLFEGCKLICYTWPTLNRQPRSSILRRWAGESAPMTAWPCQRPATFWLRPVETWISAILDAFPSGGHWPLRDPKGLSEDEVRKIRDEVKDRVKDLVFAENVG